MVARGTSSKTRGKASGTEWVEKARKLADDEMTKRKKDEPVDEDQEVAEALAALQDNRRVVQKETLVEWSADERPYKPLNREVFSTILAGVSLLGVILYFIDGIVPVMMLVAFVFMWYVFGTVKPGKITHRLTTWGLESGEKVWSWDYMVRYWFDGEDEMRLLTIEMLTGMPRFVRLVIDSPETELALRDELQDMVIEDKPKENWLDKASKWLETRIQWSVR